MNKSGKKIIEKFLNLYNHPSIILWRVIEAEAVVEYLRKTEIANPVLDLGCGDGKIASLLFDNKLDIGLDIALQDILAAKKSGLYNQTIVGDAYNLCFRNKYFGTVFSNCVIEHIPDNKKVLQEVARVLKEDGLFIFTVPSDKFGEYLFFYTLFNRIKLHKLAMWYKNKRNQLLSHFHCYNPQTWKAQAEQHGFALIYSKYYLSKSGTQWWDFVALLLFLLQKINIFKNTGVSKWLLNKTKRLQAKIVNLIFNKCNMYVQNGKSGAGLLVVLKKKQISLK